MRDILSRHDLEQSAEYFRAACHQSRAWDNLLRVSIFRYGGHGPAISGIGRAHFPDDVKAELRDLARQVSAFSELAYSARPKRVRVATIRALGRAIAARDGSGFYGPQA